MAPYLASSSLSLAVWIQLLVTVTVWLHLKASARRAALAEELRAPASLFPMSAVSPNRANGADKRPFLHHHHPAVSCNVVFFSPFLFFFAHS